MGVLTFNALPVTSLWGGVLTIAVVASGLATGLTRVGAKKYYGSVEKTTLQYRSRANGTIQEWGIWGIFLMAMMEYNSVLTPGKLWWWGLFFTVFRFTHALQLAMPSALPLPMRAGSFLLTLAIMGYAAFQLILFGHHNQ